MRPQERYRFGRLPKSRVCGRTLNNIIKAVDDTHVQCTIPTPAIDRDEDVSSSMLRTVRTRKTDTKQPSENKAALSCKSRSRDRQKTGGSMVEETTSHSQSLALVYFYSARVELLKQSFPCIRLLQL